MFLIKLTKIIEKDTGIDHRDWYVNPEQIATIMENAKGTSIAVRGFTTNTIVTQTPEEIIDAIEQGKSDNAASFWDASIPCLAQALELVEQDRIENDCGPVRLDLRGLLRRPAGDGPGTLSDAAGLRDQQG